MRGTMGLLLLASLAASCRGPYVRGPHDHGFENAFAWDRYRFHAEVFYDDFELDEIEFEDDLERIFGDEAGNVERKRAGVRVGYGVEEFRFFGQVFGEEIEDDDQSDLNPGTSIDVDDLFGIGAGVAGEPTLQRIDDHSRVILTYRGNLSIVSGEGTFRDSNPTTLLASPREEDDLAYFEQELQVGIGVDVHGFRPAIGIYSSFLWGGVDDSIVASQSDDDLFFEAFNAGIYAEFVYWAPHAPVRVGARAINGDVEGFSIFAGLSF